MTREEALLALDDVDVLIRYCAVHMPRERARQYNLGGEAFWKVVHWIAAMPKGYDPEIET
jgi:hypothetical protein